MGKLEMSDNVKFANRLNETFLAYGELFMPLRKLVESTDYERNS